MHQHMTMADLDRRNFVTSGEYASMWGVDPRTVRREIAAGRIPAVRIGSTIRIPAAWVRQQLAMGLEPTA